MTKLEPQCLHCQSYLKAAIYADATKNTCFRARRRTEQYPLNARRPEKTITLTCAGFSHINGGKLK